VANADTDVRRDPGNACCEAAGDASVHREHRRRAAPRTPNVGSGCASIRCGRRGRGHRPRLSSAGRYGFPAGVPDLPLRKQAVRRIGTWYLGYQVPDLRRSRVSHPPDHGPRRGWSSYRVCR
jgi:hypothetical protein